MSCFVPRKQSMDRTKSQDSEGRARIKSETAVTRRRHSVKHFEKSKSFGNVNSKRSLASTDTCGAACCLQIDHGGECWLVCGASCIGVDGGMLPLTECGAFRRR